jgi:hypothetical protein
MIMPKRMCYHKTINPESRGLYSNRNLVLIEMVIFVETNMFLT